MEKIFATENLEKLLPKVKTFVNDELMPLEEGHHSRPIAETYKLLDGNGKK